MESNPISMPVAVLAIMIMLDVLVLGWVLVDQPILWQVLEPLAV